MFNKQKANTRNNTAKERKNIKNKKRNNKSSNVC